MIIKAKQCLEEVGWLDDIQATTVKVKDLYWERSQPIATRLPGHDWACSSSNSIVLFKQLVSFTCFAAALLNSFTWPKTSEAMAFNILSGLKSKYWFANREEFRCAPTSFFVFYHQKVHLRLPANYVAD